MKRRAFLGSAGAAVSLGLLGRAIGGGDGTLVVRVWFSDAAAGYDDLGTRVRGYLHAALEPVIGSVQVQVAADPVSLPSEDGRAVLARHWPRLVLEGAGGLRGMDPVTGVNLLVTDGDPSTQPSGFARRHVAAMTGAESLAEMPPADGTPVEVPYSVGPAVVQLLLHECGHALGLGHDHGVARTEGGRVCASPMVSSYLWADDAIRRRKLDESGNACGDLFPPADAAGDRWLQLRYSPCALAALSEKRSSE